MSDDQQRIAAMVAWMNERHTLPMLRSEVCEIFGIHRNHWGKLAKVIEFKEIGSRVMVRVGDMPVHWLEENDLFPPNVHDFSPCCNHDQNADHSGDIIGDNSPSKG